MKKNIIIIALLTISSTFAFGQNVNDSISAKKVFGGYQFYQGDKMLSMSQLVSTMSTNELAYKQIKSAQSTSTVVMILAGVGGFMIGYPIGTALAGGEPNWTMAGIGAGTIAVAIPIGINSDKKAKQAVETYNRGLQTTSFWDKSELKLSMSGNGIGLTLTF